METLAKGLDYSAKARRKKTAYTVLKYILLVSLSVFFMLPFIFMVSKSLMSPVESQTLPVQFFPKGFYWKSYVDALDASLLRYFLNTVIVVVCGMFSGPLSASLVAFGFSRVKFKGSGFCFALVLGTMMIPGMVLEIPMYIIYAKYLSWTDTLLPLIVPGFFGGGALSIFLMRQFMKSIPMEIDNAARIDGANLFQIYSKIMLPLCKPIILFFVIQTGLGAFNNFQGPLLYLQDEKVYTMAVGIFYKFSVGMTTAATALNVRAATGVILALPALIIFFKFQKQLIDGVMVGALKG